jgi:hypothetical protein
MSNFSQKRTCKMCRKAFRPIGFAQEICLDCGDKVMEGK